MPTVACPSCGANFEIGQKSLEDEAICPECGVLLFIIIEDGELRTVVEVEEEELDEEEEEWEELEEKEE